MAHGQQPKQCVSKAHNLQKKSFKFLADNLVEFHRSYALKGNHDGEQCTDRELDDFYLQHGSTIRNAYRQQQPFNDVEGNSREDDQQDREQFDSRFDEDSDEWNDQEENNNNKQQQRRQNKRRQTQGDY